MPRAPSRLPKRFPVGSKYVVESQGRTVSRYVDFPDGRRVVLAKRTALSPKIRSLQPPTRTASRMGYGHGLLSG